MVPAQQTASPMSEGLLWQLYRRLLAEHLLRRLLSGKIARGPGLGIAAALTENLLPGDTVGLPASDLATRYLCGVPLAGLRAQPRRGRRTGWAFEADSEHGLLPGNADEQAGFAVGTAMAARLHQTGRVTVLAQTLPVRAAARLGPAQAKSSAPAVALPGVPAWTHAVETAVALQLPLLFISPAPAAGQPVPGRPPTALPAIPVDRCDALALYRVIYESAARARTGGGPTWIECSAWPLAAPESALDKMEQALRARNLFDRRRQKHLEEGLMKELAHPG